MTVADLLAAYRPRPDDPPYRRYEGGVRHPLQQPPEQWAAIPGYEGLYEASDHGNVRSLPRVVKRGGGRGGLSPRRYDGRVLRQDIDNQGRPVVVLYRDAVRTRIRVQQLVLMAFRGLRPKGMEACHYDGDKLNNRLDNLRWDTHWANVRDRIRHDDHHNAHKTHCPQGHPYAGDNLRMVTVRGRPARRCRACERVRNHAKYVRRRDAMSGTPHPPRCSDRHRHPVTCRCSADDQPIPQQRDGDSDEGRTDR